MNQIFRLAVSLPAVLFMSSLGYAQLAGSVDQFLCVSGGGNDCPGPTMPFGMIKPGPDMVATGESDPNAGWNATGDIRDFSRTHVSGSGGGAKYGNVLVMPTTSTPVPFGAESPRENERASAGFYSVTLARYGIAVEITATRRAAIYRFRYPENKQSNLLFNMGHCLSLRKTNI